MAVSKNFETKAGVSVTHWEVTGLLIDYVEQKAILKAECYLDSDAKEAKKEPVGKFSFDIPWNGVATALSNIKTKAETALSEKDLSNV